MATMPSYAVALAWMIIAPFAFLTDCLAVIFIFHYKPLYHSCDVAFISLFVTMATNAWLLLPIPAVVKLAGFYWSQSLCAFYTWLSVTLRSSHILVVLVLNVYWMASLRVSKKNNLFTSTKPITASVFICWFISLVVGLIPAADVAHVFGYYEDNVCKFLPSNISRGFAIFFIIVPLVSTVMGVVSSLDSLLLFKAMKDVALTKYSADRFHLPTISGGLSTSSRIHAKYNELNVTIELCRLVLLFSMASSVLNAIPLLASQFVQLIQEYSRESLEATLLWLLLMEALVLPHLLWLLSRRYRHAVAYTWRVFVLRDTSAREEDTASCSLQAFRANVKDVTSRPYRNGGINTRQTNGTVSGPGIEDNHEEPNSNGNYNNRNGNYNNRNGNYNNRNGNYNTPQPRSNGFLHVGSGHDNRVLEYSLVSSINAAGMASGSASDSTSVKRITLPEVVILHEISRQGITQAQKKGHGYNEVRETSLSSGQISERDNPTRTGSIAIVHDVHNEDNFSQLTSPIKRSTKTSAAGQVKRSVSSSSRMEWKERMMKKHLPTVFLSSSVEDETDTDPTSDSIDYTENATSQTNMAPRKEHDNSTTSRRRDIVSRSHENWTSTESTYYLSGDYHYEYLNDTLAQSHPHSSVDTGESAGKYAEEDITTILDSSLTSENCVNAVSNCDSDNYLLTSRTVCKLESDTELLKNATHVPQKIKATALLSTEIQQRESNNSTNSHQKYAEDVPNTVTNIDASHNDPLLTGSSQSTLSDQTDLGGRSHTESVSQPTAIIVSVSSGQPTVRRSNYRKFLPYTDLIISDVDDVTADENVEEDDRNVAAEVKVPTVKSENIVGNFNHLHKEPITVKEMKASSSSENQNNLQTPRTGTKFIPEKTETRDKDEDYVQDYSKCETVSGSEMLRLKMKSIRAAAAMYLSDDNTSDDGGIDNNGFTETSNDDSDDNNDHYDEKQNTTWFNDTKININKGIVSDGIHSGREDSKQFMSTLQADDDDDELAEVMIERDGAGDGEESTLDAHINSKAVAAIIPFSKQSGGNKNEASVIRNYDLVKSSDVFEPKPSDHLKITSNLRPRELANTTPQNVGRVRHGVSEDYSYAHLTDSASSKEHSANFSTQSDVTTTISELHMPSDEQSTHPAEQQISKAKPPRHRKQPDDSPLLLSDAAKGSIHGTAIDFEDKVIPATKSIPYFESANGAIPINEDMAIEPDISEVTDTDSNGSELSVTLEPYGYRRPDWMNDVLLSSSSPKQTMFKKAREISNLEEESTDFVSPNYSTVSRHTDDASLTAARNHNNSVGVPYNSYQPPALPSHQTHPVLVPYHFNDDTDDEYGDSIIIDYSAQSNFYRHKNLYFEAIKEEPEDLLSDSASSFDQSENSFSNVLRDTPTTTRGQIDSNIAVQFNSNKPVEFLQSLPKISNTLPTSERTSADGSEAIPPTNASNCLSNSHTSKNTLIKTNLKIKPDPMQQRITLKDLAKQTAKTDANSVVLSEKYTEKQNFHTPGTTIKDNVQRDNASLHSNVNKHDSVATTDYRPANGPYDHETKNSGFLGFHNGVKFPGPLGSESSRGEAVGATPVYF